MVMDANLNQVFDAAMALPASDRLALVSLLLDTVVPVADDISLDDPSLLDELDRRFNDREGAVDWSELRAEP
jgi:hypothetical protein